MTSYIVRRLLQAILVLIIVSLLVFFVMRLLPGDPLTIYIIQNDISLLTPEDEAALRHEFGLDKPLMIQYVDWLSGILHGDFGTSIHFDESVGKLLAERIPVTLYLGLVSLAISCFFGVLFGLVAALRRGSTQDTSLTSVANFGVSTPSFWLGILLIYLVGLHLGWLPIQGYTSPFDDFWLSTKKLIMPVFVLATWSMAFLSRQSRSSILEVVRQDYIRTAWAKGLRERVVVSRHVLKNGLIPIITVMGMLLSMTIGGTVVIENVFNIPGMGRLLVSSVFSQDYQVVQASIFVIGVAVVLANLVVDIAYGWLDPRIRYD
jgi:peptide/nickel transport system permease protein